MFCEINWPLVVDLIKGLAPAVVAAVVGWVAYQQWITAKNKLALDLFDRRFAIHRRLSDLIEARLKEDGKKPNQPFLLFAPRSPTAIALEKEAAEARFLFGNAVKVKLDQIIAALQQVVDAKAAMLAKDVEQIDGEEAHNLIGAWAEKSKLVALLVVEFNALVEPYMMLDAISVNRPKAPKGLWLRRS